jgi:hypothetical protein
MRRASWIAIVTGAVGLLACGAFIAFCGLTLALGSRYDATVEHASAPYDDVCADVRVSYGDGHSGSIDCEDPGVEVGDTIPVVVGPTGDLDSVEGYGILLMVGVVAAVPFLLMVGVGGVLLLVQRPPTRPNPSTAAA